ncbi:hypothetical protein Pla108_06440 [Botrimarina colliarenosi]|uniref:Outer membrane efflux protein n=1 Tax=Botrimarina colliarenosi TaxID=2528001 RepID=A0A5C6AL02_9BACT|nr:hypothetical protein [Botrimarina colliarenosi]TWT99701.1 hypothetical protein Pla108_06440 [Botrimarina colliarenosi]
MRFALSPALFCAIVLSPFDALAAEEDRYGGDLSTYDFGSFDKASPSSAVGGYHSPSTNPGSTAASPTTTTPSSSSNDLRSGASPSSTTLPPRPSQSQVTLPTTTRPTTAPTTNPNPPSPRGSEFSAGSSQATLPSRSTTPGYGSSNSGSPNYGTSPSYNTTPSYGSTPNRSTSPTASAASPSTTPSDLRSYSQPSTSRQATTPTSPAYGSTSNQPTRQNLSESSALTSRVGSTVDPQAGVRERKTQEMLEKMLRPRSDSKLSGTPMSLTSVVSSAASREEQARRVDAYWSLTSAVADYYLGLAEVGEMDRLRQRLSTYSTTIGQAQTSLNTRINTSLKAARAAQFRLAQLMGGGVMPLPSDTPFTGPYATRFETVFPAGAPEEARLVAELLPLRLIELQDAAESVASSESWISRVASDQAAQSDGTGVMRALELLALNRRAFVQIARDYNLQINRYTQLAAPERVDTGRLVAMLIRTAPTGAQSAEDALMAGFSAGATNSASRTPSTDAPARR